MSGQARQSELVERRENKTSFSTCGVEFCIILQCRSNVNGATVA